VLEGGGLEVNRESGGPVSCGPLRVAGSGIGINGLGSRSASDGGGCPCLGLGY
jgi:hypothetical protein